MPSTLPFTKMQALGNDFVILEEKYLKNPLTYEEIRWIANRRQGIGCDQVILIKNSSTADADIAFFNADGREAMACGNGTRCVAKYLGKEKGRIQTPSFLSHFWRKGENITISLKEPLFLPSQFLIQEKIQAFPINLGNPHLVIFTDDIISLPLEDLALSLQPPEGINVELAQIISPTVIKARVWERGVGITPACGSGACAIGILSLKLGLIKKSPVFIEMEGGTLEVAWEENSPPLLTGPATYCFKGTFDLP
ncbi:MAG: diaminopimelate epimerase [Proteobacteria bacterium]|nr:diaminopimelate epimerase [Pseudomonadota bacterium]